MFRGLKPDPAVAVIVVGLACAIATAARPMWLEFVAVVELAPLSLEQKLEIRDAWAAKEFVIAKDIDRAFPGTDPIVLARTDSRGWIIALHLQPRRSYFRRRGVLRYLDGREERAIQLQLTVAKIGGLSWGPYRLERDPHSASDGENEHTATTQEQETGR